MILGMIKTALRRSRVKFICLTTTKIIAIITRGRHITDTQERQTNKHTCSLPSRSVESNGGDKVRK